MCEDWRALPTRLGHSRLEASCHNLSRRATCLRQPVRVRQLTNAGPPPGRCFTGFGVLLVTSFLETTPEFISGALVGAAWDLVGGMILPEAGIRRKAGLKQFLARKLLPRGKGFVGGRCLWRETTTADGAYESSNKCAASATANTA